MEGKQFREAIGGLRKIEVKGDDDGKIKEEIVNMEVFKEIAS
jgi:hypothetical protein